GPIPLGYTDGDFGRGFIDFFLGNHRHVLEEVDGPGFLVEARFELAVLPKCRLRGFEDRRFHGFDEHSAVDALFLGDLLHDVAKICLESLSCHVSPVFSRRSSPAFVSSNHLACAKPGAVRGPTRAPSAPTECHRTPGPTVCCWAPSCQ